MKRILTLVITFSLFSSFSFGQMEMVEKIEVRKDPFKYYAEPGSVHHNLQLAVGFWTEKATMWATPSSEPISNSMNCSINMILGNRYQVATHTGDFNGFPFEGISTLAYDTASKKFTSTWIDNMGTGMMILEGTADATGKVITSIGTTTNPANGEKLKVKEVYTIIDQNHHQMEMYTTYKGKEFKSMEIFLNK